MSSRIAFFIHDLRSGGAERNLVRLINGMAARGIATDLVLVNKVGVYFEELDPRVEIFELPQKRTATAPLGLKAYLDRRRPDVLISSLTHINVAAIIGRALARHSPRLVVTERNQFTRNRNLKTGLVRFGYSLVPRLYRRADVVGAVAEGVRDDLALATGLPAAKIEVLHNPVVSDEIFQRAKERPKHRWFAPDRTVPVILGVGRLTRQKNFSVLIEAFAKLRREREARLVILGEGDLREQLLEEVRRRGLEADVDLAGFDANPFAYMAAADVFALTSDWEGLPTVLIEALACGVPVVATDCDSGSREVLANGAFGQIVPMGDADAIAKALARAIDEPRNSAALVERARMFSLENSVARYLEVCGLEEQRA